jgi:adenosylcobinamide-GDP ribazoletransferase
MCLTHSQMTKLKLALSFLTIFPVHLTEALQPGDLGRAAVWFPLVGMMIGLLVAVARLGLVSIFPGPLAAVLVVTVWVVLTGGLHLDGLADCCDGLLAAVPPERRLEIMKDPRLGTFGGAGLLLYLLIKIGALFAIPVLIYPDSGILTSFLPLLLAPALARWLVLIVAHQPMARPGGLGAEFALGVSWRTFLFAALIPLILVALGGWRGLAAAFLAHLITLAVILFARSRLNGMTGDVLGLTIELGEAAVLLVFAIR